ncbi:MAG: hypothetical protein ACRC8S_15795 [Fimbriiglobus sp.]
MNLRKHLLTLALGAALGVGVMYFANTTPQPVKAGSVDRFQDFIMATGAVSLNARTQLDGVWMLDYRAGKLLGTCIDKTQGKTVGWAEVDLVSEFEVQPRQDVHFMMVTGYISQGQSALYVAETVTGKFGVYTMSAGPNGQGVVVRRHDLTTFRKTAQPGEAPAPSTNQPLITPMDVPPPAAPGQVVGEKKQGN